MNYKSQHKFIKFYRLFTDETSLRRWGYRRLVPQNRMRIDEISLL